MGRKPKISDGWRTCTRCLQRLEETSEHFYYTASFNQWSSKCKDCHREASRESAEKNKYDAKRRALIKEAKEKGDTMKQCPKCKDMNPSGSFKPYDTNVYLNDTLILKGYEEICGVCYYKLHDAVFSKINGCIAYAKERQGRKPRKRKLAQ